MELNPEFRNIDFELLDLDTKNPRLPKSLHGSTEEKILEYMLLDGSLIELMMAIGKNGFFAGEQLLVVKISDAPNEKYKTIEGNRRLSAVKLLNDPKKASVQKHKVSQVIEETRERPKLIPCLIFKEDKQIHDYLGYRHITGIKEWKLLEKARYLNDFFNTNYGAENFEEASRELAKSIGSTRDYVKRLISGYQIFQIIEDKAYFKIVGLNDTTFWFNYIADSLTRENLREFLNIQIDAAKGLNVGLVNETNLKYWVTWFFEKNQEGSTRLIGDSKTLTLLNTVLGNHIAKDAFISKGATLKEAYELTDEIDIQFINYLSNSIRQLERADSISLKVSQNYSEIKEFLNINNNLLKKIAESLKSKEKEQDEF